MAPDDLAGTFKHVADDVDDVGPLRKVLTTLTLIAPFLL